MATSASFRTRVTAMVRAFFGRAVEPERASSPAVDVERERRRGPGV